MAALYLAIIFSPLAAFAIHSPDTAPATVRECSGDCNLCGCSPESRASNTCCCSNKKRQQQAHLHEDDQNSKPDCCKKKPVEKKTVIACGCPCGKGQQAALSVNGSSELLPYHFTEQLSIPHTDTTYINLTRRLTSRHGEPPDPPPKLSVCS
jgi:hypothetical protein